MNKKNILEEIEREILETEKIIEENSTKVEIESISTYQEEMDSLRSGCELELARVMPVIEMGYKSME